MNALARWVLSPLSSLSLLNQDPGPPPSQGPEFGGSSPIGLVVTLVLLIALVFLIKSMNKHLGKLPTSFDEQAPSNTPATTTEPAAEPTTAAAAPAADAPPAPPADTEQPNGSTPRA
jgi:hypothetical protein